MDALQNTGLQEDCPFSQEEGAEQLTPESAQQVPDEQFMEYAGRLNAYLQARDQNFYSQNSYAEEIYVLSRDLGRCSCGLFMRRTTWPARRRGGADIF